MVRDDGDQVAKAEEEMIWTILHWAGVIVAIYITYKGINYLAKD